MKNCNHPNPDGTTSHDTNFDDVVASAQKALDEGVPLKDLLKALLKDTYDAALAAERAAAVADTRRTLVPLRAFVVVDERGEAWGADRNSTYEAWMSAKADPKFVHEDIDFDAFRKRQHKRGWRCVEMIERTDGEPEEANCEP